MHGPGGGCLGGVGPVVAATVHSSTDAIPNAPPHRPLSSTDPYDGLNPSLRRDCGPHLGSSCLGTMWSCTAHQFYVHRVQASHVPDAAVLRLTAKRTRGQTAATMQWGDNRNAYTIVHIAQQHHHDNLSQHL